MRDDEVGMIYKALVEYGYSLNTYNTELSELIEVFLQKVFSKFSKNIQFNDYMVNVSFISKKNMENAFKFITNYLGYDDKDIDLFVEKIDEEKELQKAEEENIKQKKLSEINTQIKNLKKEYKQLNEEKEKTNEKKGADLLNIGKDIDELSIKHTRELQKLDMQKTTRNIKSIEREKNWINTDYNKQLKGLNHTFQKVQNELERYNKKTNLRMKAIDDEIKSWRVAVQDIQNERNEAMHFLPEKEISMENYVPIDNKKLKVDAFVIGENTWLLNLMFPKKYTSFKFNKKNSVNPFLEKFKTLKNNKNYNSYLSKLNQLKNRRIDLSKSGTKKEIKELDNSIDAIEQRQVIANLNINNAYNEMILEDMVEESTPITNEEIFDRGYSFPEDEIIDIGGSSRRKLKRNSNPYQISNAMNEKDDIISTSRNIINTSSAMNEEEDIISTSNNIINTSSAMNEEEDILNMSSYYEKKRKVTPNSKRNSPTEDKEDEKEDTKVKESDNNSNKNTDDTKPKFDMYYHINN